MTFVPVYKYKAMFISTLVIVFLFCFWYQLSASSSTRNSREHNSHTEEQVRTRINQKSKMCYVNSEDRREHLAGDDLPMIYYVTPTYPRPEQYPELTRLSHTLMHVPKIHWIVADDQPQCSNELLKLLWQTKLPFTLLSSPKPVYRRKPRILPRGVANRRAALKWLRETSMQGIVYFGDDDNTVDLQLFEEIRKTRKVSMFPVGLIGEYGVSSPVVKDGKVIGFFDPWPGNRTFPIDMAGFAVNLKYIVDSNADMPFKAGYEEDGFLVNLGVKLDEIEPLADNCSRILVWHTRSLKYKKPTVRIRMDKFKDLNGFSDFAKLLEETNRLGMANLDPDSGKEALIIRDNKTHKLFSWLVHW